MRLIVGCYILSWATGGRPGEVGSLRWG